MKTKIAMAALLAATMAGTAAHAQSVPEGQSCGGLLCDMGVFGHKTEPKPAPPPQPAPVAQAATPASEPTDPEPKKVVRKKKRVAAAARETGSKKTAPKDVAAEMGSVPERQAVTERKPARPTIVAAPAKSASVVQMPLPLGWETAKAPAVAPVEPPVEAPKPPPAAPASNSVNVINLYSALPSAGIRPLY